MSEDDKVFYVTRHEFENSQGKIYEKINENDRKHTDAINDLGRTVDRQVILLERQFESQERSEKHLERLNTTMNKFGNEITDIKYRVKNHDEKIEDISSDISDKQKGNAQITSIFISGLFGIITAAIGVAHYFL